MDKEYLGTMLDDYVNSCLQLDNARTHNQRGEAMESIDLNRNFFLDALEEEINTMINNKIKGIMA